MRIDLLMVEKGFAQSRSRAQAMIAGGKVFVVSGGQRKAVTKASMQIDPEDKLEVDGDALRFVSRGGLKLQGALEKTGIDPFGCRVLDVGISTGGFTDCLLQAGAARVIGIDVGRDQLAQRLRTDSRVQLFEGVNARDLSSVPLKESNDGRGFGLIVVDVSFISLTLVLSELIQYLEDSSSILALVKPQFEVGREGIGKNGIVKDAKLYAGVEDKIRKTCAGLGLRVEAYFESPIEGSDGNREFFVWAKPAQLLLGEDSGGGFGNGADDVISASRHRL